MPAETKTYVERVKGFLGGNASRETAVAKKEVTPAEEVMTKALPAGTTAQATFKNMPDMANMPASYQAAFALAALADAQDEEDDKAFNENKPTESEKLLADYKPINHLASLDLSVKPLRTLRMADGGEVGLDGESEGSSEDSKLNFFNNVNRMRDQGVTTDSVMLGANKKLGDGSLMGGVNFSNMSNDEKLQTARALMLAYTQQDPEGLGINANVVKPLSPSGPSMKNLMGSLPLGEGRVSAGLHGNKAYSLGYSQPIEGGQFNANLNVPRNNPSAAQLNLQYNKRFADGGEIAEMQDTARKGEAYQGLEKYLQARNAMPTVKISDNMPYGTNGLFTADVTNIGDGFLQINKNTDKNNVPSVLTHEMTHAADRQMKQQAMEQGMFGKSNQFTEAYEKLVGPEGVNRTKIARKINPEWTSDNQYYRSDPKEIVAHGVGSFAGSNTQDRAPRHVDATAATEFQILMDLAQRNVDKGPKGLEKIPAFFRKLGRYADGGEVYRAEGSPEEGEIQFKENKNPSFNQRLAEAMARDEIGNEGYYLRDSSTTASKQLAQLLKASNTALPASSVTSRALPPRYISDEFNAAGWTYGSGPLKGQIIIAGDIPITHDPKDVMDRVNTQAHEAFHQRAGEEGHTLLNRKSYSDDLARNQIAKIMREFQPDSDVKKGSAPNEISTAYWGLRPNRSKEEQIANLAGYEGMHPKGTSFLNTEVGKRMLKDDPRLIDYYFTQSSVPYGGVWEGQVKEPGMIDNASRMLKKFLVKKGINTVNRAEGSPKEGEVAPTAEEIAAASTPAFIAQKSGIGRKAGTVSQALQSGEGQKEFLKGLTNVPQNIVGAPMDISNMIANVYGGGVEKPFMGSEYIKEGLRAKGLGFTPSTDPTLAGFYAAGDLGSNLVNPAGVTRTGVKAAEKTGEAAKMLARDFQQYNQNLAVPGASYAMKPKGGHYYVWPESSAASEKSQVDAYLQMIENRMERPNAAVADWVKNKVGRYIRSDFATEQDQMVKAAEEGKKLHFTTPTAFEKSPPILDPSLTIMRRTEGFPPQGFAKTEQGKLVEDIVDSSVWPATLDNTPTDYIPSSIRGLKDTDPNMRIYEFPDAVFEDNMRITDLANKMDKMMTEKTIKLWNQDVPVPKEYQLDTDTLKGLTPAQASNRVAMKEEWLAKKEPEVAGQALAKDPQLVSHRYDNGSKWISPADLSENDMHRQMVNSIGCRGGWCTDKDSFALDYGSGDNRLHILLDKKFEPRVQLTLNNPTPRITEFANYVYQTTGDKSIIEDLSRSAYGWSTEMDAQIEARIKAMPEYQDFLKQNQATTHITEIKGQFNSSDLRNSPYLKQIQDFVKRQGPELQSVDNQKDIRMVDMRDIKATTHKINGIVLDNNLLNRFLKVNGNSYFADQDEYAALIKKASEMPNNTARQIQMNMFQPPAEKAYGGMIERQPTDNRRYL